MRESILVVDDEAGVRSSLSGILSDEGYAGRRGGERRGVPAGAGGPPLRPGPARRLAARHRRPGDAGPRAHPRPRGAGGHDLRPRHHRDRGARPCAWAPTTSSRSRSPSRRPCWPCSNALRQRRLEAENRALKAQVEHRWVMVGESAAMHALRAEIAQAAPSQRPGADLRRERHRQGAGGAHHPPAEPRAHGALRGGQLRRHPRGPDRERAVRAHARAPSPAPSRPARASSSWPTAARCSWTRSAT